MRAYNTYWSSYILLEENIVVSDKINKYIQRHVTAATCRIAKGLQWHYLFEKRIKIIHYLQNGLL